MPPKINPPIYPRYFRSEDPAFQDCIIVFPAFGSLGTAYYPKMKRWSRTPQWKLSEMNEAPKDIEITAECRANRFQAIAYDIPKELPPFKAEV